MVSDLNTISFVKFQKQVSSLPDLYFLQLRYISFLFSDKTIFSFKEVYMMFVLIIIEIEIWKYHINFRLLN